MKLTNVKNIDIFNATVEACTGNVFLKSLEGDVFNLKSSMSRYIAIGRLIEESGDSLELFAEKKEDEARLIGMLNKMAENN